MLSAGAKRKGTPMTVFEWIMLGLCALVVILPPKHDPAIRLKECGKEKGNIR
jgi:hypothetical protein